MQTTSTTAEYNFVNTRIHGARVQLHTPECTAAHTSEYMYKSTATHTSKYMYGNMYGNIVAHKSEYRYNNTRASIDTEVHMHTRASIINE
jgi:nitrate reductase cytochrome c-type subunit